jgi:hypothetical protein
MKPTAFLRSTIAVLALAASIPAAAVAQMKIIAVQAKVGGTSYGVAPNTEEIPVNVGDRVRVDLVGTSIEGGRGVERPVNARFDVAAGRGRLDIVQAGPNWAVVSIRSAGDGVAQLGYSVSGNYDMRSNMRDGRINFQIADNGRTRGGQSGQSRADERWDRADELTRRLYRGILGQDPRGGDTRQDIDRIYRDGSSGVREVALSLAREAQRDRNRMGEDEAIRVLGDLYRGLLRRDMSNRDLWERDRGFRGNVDTLRRDGLVRIVDVIVTSEEFRSVNKLFDLDRPPRGDRGDRGGRYDRDQRDRRPPAL